MSLKIVAHVRLCNATWQTKVPTGHIYILYLVYVVSPSEHQMESRGARCLRLLSKQVPALVVCEGGLHSPRSSLLKRRV